jgi:hypothetical protein
MKKLAILSAAALIGLGGIASTGAEAGPRRNGGAIAAGVIGGLAAGALLGAATSNAYAAPAYGYGYAPAYGYGYAPSTRVVQSYGYAPEVYEEAYVPRRAYRTTAWCAATRLRPTALPAWCGAMTAVMPRQGIGVVRA